MESSDVIVLQGAMNLELSYFLSQLQDLRPVNHTGFNFWQGRLAGKNVVLSQTGVGTAMAGAATALAIEFFRPALIINQGTAGAYDRELSYGDIVVGTRVFNGNAVHVTPQGISRYIDMSSLEDESDFDKMFLSVPKYFLSQEEAVSKVKEAAGSFTQGRVVEGTIASFDQWNMEAKKIKKLQLETGALCEEMEAGAVATVAAARGVPFLALRVISNNNTLGTPFKGDTALVCQQFVEQLLKL